MTNFSRRPDAPAPRLPRGSGHLAGKRLCTPCVVQLHLRFCLRASCRAVARHARGGRPDGFHPRAHRGQRGADPSHRGPHRNRQARRRAGNEQRRSFHVRDQCGDPVLQQLAGLQGCANCEAHAVDGSRRNAVERDAAAGSGFLDNASRQDADETTGVGGTAFHRVSCHGPCMPLCSETGRPGCHSASQWC